MPIRSREEVGRRVSTAWRSAVHFIAAMLALALALVVIVTTLAFVFERYTAMPFLDSWGTVLLARKHALGELSLADLWRPHNEHRIFVPRLIFLADFKWFSSFGLLPVAITWGVQLAHALLLAALVRPALREGRLLHVAVVGLFLALVFSDAQEENLIQAFQVQFTLVFLAATAACVALGKRKSGSGWWLVASLLAAVVGSLSMANGVLVWPILVLLAHRLQLPRGEVWLVAAVGAMVGAVYAHDYELNLSSDGAGPVSKFVLEVPAFAAGMVASGFRGLLPSRGAGVLTGAAGIACFAALAVSVLHAGWRARSPSRTAAVEAAELVLVHAGFFLLATALVTALGRAHLGLAAAGAPRYATPAMLFWCVVFGLGVVRGGRFGGSVAAVVALFTAAAALQQCSHWPDETWRRRIAGAELALRCGIIDENVRALAGPFWHAERPDLLRGLVGFLRARRLALFAAADQYGEGLLGRDLRERFAVAEGLASGAIDEMALVADSGGAFTLGGWAWCDGDRAPAAAIVLADAGGRVIGRAIGFGERSDVAAARPEVTDARIAWIGAGALGGAKGSIVAYAVTRDGRASPFAVRELATTELVAATEIGARLASASFVHESWRVVAGPHAPGEDHRALRFHPPSEQIGLAVAVFGPFVVDRAGSVAVPVQTGPAPWSASVRLVEATTGATVTSLHLAPMLRGWAYWRARVPAAMAGRALALVVAASGTEAQQWIAVAPPRALR